VAEMQQFGWDEGKSDGSEGGDCLLERRISLEIVVFCFITLFCRRMLLIDGNGYLTQLKSV